MKSSQETQGVIHQKLHSFLFALNRYFFIYISESNEASELLVEELQATPQGGNQLSLFLDVHMCSIQSDQSDGKRPITV